MLPDLFLDMPAIAVEHIAGIFYIGDQLLYSEFVDTGAMVFFTRAHNH